MNADKIEEYIFEHLGRIVLALVLVVLVLIGGCGYGCYRGVYPNYSDGLWAGTIVKFSNKGLIWKSWEGEINCGGLVAGSDGKFQPNIMPFNCPKELAGTVQKALDNGKPVRLYYKQWLSAPIKIDDSHVVTKLEEGVQ